MSLDRALKGRYSVPSTDQTNEGTKMSTYNGWKNKETWLVNVWYMDSMPEYFADAEQWVVEPDELSEAVEYIALESEMMSQLPDSGLIADFVNMCFADVDWRTLAEHLNETLADMCE